MPMHRLALSATLLLLVAAPLVEVAEGQNTTPADTALRAARSTPRPATDSLFRRARRQVAEGNGVAGRALVDSLMRAADPATPAYGDALYWHGALAPTAAEAERDYRRVIVEYPLAYYADDALLAIAELEQARGDRAGALAHLQRYVKDHPASPERGVAALGAARLAFEQRDQPLGCSMIAAARGSALVTDVELRNQIEYYGRQCTGALATASTPPTAPAPTAPAPSPTPATASPVTRVPATRATATATPRERASTNTSANASATAAATATATARTSTMPEPVTPPPRPAPAPTPTPLPSRPAPSRTAQTRPPVARPGRVTPPTTTPSAAPSPGASATRSAAMYTIQLAAYDTRPPAEQLVRKLATRGVKARVSGTAKPFRVRLDFYRTQREAVTVVSALKARGIIGFVTKEVPPAEARSP
jgi:hypothetical protein